MVDGSKKGENKGAEGEGMSPMKQWKKLDKELHDEAVKKDRETMQRKYEEEKKSAVQGARIGNKIRKKLGTGIAVGKTNGGSEAAAMHAVAAVSLVATLAVDVTSNAISSICSMLCNSKKKDSKAVTLRSNKP